MSVLLLRAELEQPVEYDSVEKAFYAAVSMRKRKSIEVKVDNWSQVSIIPRGSSEEKVWETLSLVCSAAPTTKAILDTLQKTLVVEAHLTIDLAEVYCFAKLHGCNKVRVVTSNKTLYHFLLEFGFEKEQTTGISNFCCTKEIGQKSINVIE